MNIYELQSRIHALPLHQYLQLTYLEPNIKAQPATRYKLAKMSCMTHNEVPGKHFHMYAKTSLPGPDCETANDGELCELLKNGTQGCALRHPSLLAIIQRSGKRVRSL